MQVSASNLIIAAQQMHNPAPARSTSDPVRADRSQKPAPADFASDSFAPIAFKVHQAEAPAPAVTPQAPSRFSPVAPLGSQVDIRV